MVLPLAVWIQHTTVTDGQTDWRTDTGRWLVPRLRIASHGKIELAEFLCYEQSLLMYYTKNHGHGNETESLRTYFRLNDILAKPRPGNCVIFLQCSICSLVATCTRCTC